MHAGKGTHQTWKQERGEKLDPRVSEEEKTGVDANGAAREGGAIQ